MKTSIVGNLTISEGEHVVTIGVNTIVVGKDGLAQALFTYDELPKLIEILKRVRRPVAAPAPDDDEDDWSDLV